MSQPKMIRPKAPSPGDRFGRLILLYEADPKPYVSKKDGHTRYRHRWMCKCDCGNEKIIDEKTLKTGETRSCGCLRNETTGNRSRTHGASKTHLYKIYHAMLKRCYNAQDPGYVNYGGRGIEVCDAWRESFESFASWAYSAGYIDGYASETDLFLDRIDNEAGYSPDNCRWASRQTQNSNTRANRYIEYNGESHTITEWGRITGIGWQQIGKRIDQQGYSIEDALDPKDHRAKYVEYNGVVHTVKEWAELYNLRPGLVRSRLSRGWSIESALTIPPKQHKKENV